MESDYGMSLFNDDGKDEYPEYETEAVLTALMADVTADEEDDNDYIPLKKDFVVNEKKVRTNGPAFKGKKNGMKKKRRRLTGPEEFFQLVLSWDINKLSLDSRKALNLTPVTEMPSYFSDGLTYFDTMKQVAIEEARASLSQGLKVVSNQMERRIASDQMELKIAKVQSNLDESSLVLVMFTIVKGATELTRPGSVFKLVPSDVKPNNSDRYNRNGNNGGRSQTPFLREKNVTNDYNASLAVVAVGSQAMSLTNAMGGFNTTLPMWIHSSSPLSKLLLGTNADSFLASRWTAYSIGSVLSYQRMATVCSDAPSPPFMLKLMGHKPSIHIKFDSDDDDEGNSNGKTQIENAVTFNPIQCTAIHDYREFKENENNGDDAYSSTSHDFHSDDDSSNNQILNDIILQGLSIKSTEMIKSLNASQLSALHDCVGISRVGSEVSELTSSDGNLHLVLGPPGCGKTHFLVATLISLIAKHSTMVSVGSGNMRIMVCAPSNKAVCVVLEQFLKSGILSDTVCRTSGVRCALVGVMDKLEGCSSSILVTDDFKDVFPAPLIPWTITNLTSRFIHPITAADVYVLTYAKGLSTALAAIIHFLEDTIKLKIEVLYTALHTWPYTIETVFPPFCDVTHLSATIIALKSEYSSLLDAVQADVPDFFEKNLKKSWSSALREFSSISCEIECLRPDAFDDNNCNIGSEAESGKLNNDVKSNNAKTLKNKKTKTKPRSDTSVTPVFVNPLPWDKPSVADLQNYVAGVRHQHMIIIGHMRDLYTTVSTPSACDELAIVMLQSSCVVFCTLTSSGSSIVKSNVREIDVLIVDEAAQALEVELLIPLAAAPRNLILVGDPKQLPACVLSVENQRSKRGESSMQRLMERCAYPSLLLDTQYRMHPAISLLPNRLFYEGRLQNSDQVHRRPGIFRSFIPENMGISDSPSTSSDSVCGAFVSVVENEECSLRWLRNYSFIDTPGGGQGKAGGESGGGKLGKSVCNEQEAHTVVKLANYLKIQSGLNLQTQVCVITFYAGQVTCINRALKTAGLGSDGLRVMTVDSFQGSECDVVILSFVRSNAHGSVGFVKDFQRLNVALTRAKHLLLCVGCAQTLEKEQKKPSDSLAVTPSNHLAEIVKDARERSRLFLGSELFT